MNRVEQQDVAWVEEHMGCIITPYAFNGHRFTRLHSSHWFVLSLVLPNLHFGALSYMTDSSTLNTPAADSPQDIATYH